MLPFILMTKIWYLCKKNEAGQDIDTIALGRHVLHYNFKISATPSPFLTNKFLTSQSPSVSYNVFCACSFPLAKYNMSKNQKKNQMGRQCYTILSNVHANEWSHDLRVTKRKYFVCLSLVPIVQRIVRRSSFTHTHKSILRCLRTPRRSHQSPYFGPYCLHFVGKRVLDLSHWFSNGMWAVYFKYTLALQKFFFLPSTPLAFMTKIEPKQTCRTSLYVLIIFFPSKMRGGAIFTICQTIDWYIDGGIRSLLFGCFFPSFMP